MALTDQLTPATNLDEVWKTLSNAPLTEEPEFTAFYRKDVNDVRGNDKIAVMQRGLRQRFGGAFYKTLLMGHPGVGKSTEMTRLAISLKDKFRVIRFSAQSDLHPAGFKPFDVLLVMMIKLVDEVHLLVNEVGETAYPPEELLREIVGWFDSEKITTKNDLQKDIDASAEAGVKLELHKLLSIGATLKGEIKYTTSRTQEIVQYRLNALSNLIKLLNRLIGECNEILRRTSKCEWIFIGEDFDKAGIPRELTEDLFINYSNILEDLQTHLIFNVPVELAYSEKKSRFPIDLVGILDTPVFDEHHDSHALGRDALKTVLEARINSNLFGSGEMNRLIVASGGNLRDLFDIVSKAADNAALAGRDSIEAEDREFAINDKRLDYKRRLGDAPFNAQAISYDERVKRLLSVYNQEPGNGIADAHLYSLLTARAVQEFNGKGWYGVHPLVVDILIDDGKIKTTDGSTPRGGTYGT